MCKKINLENPHLFVSYYREYFNILLVVMILLPVFGGDDIITRIWW